MLPSIRVHRKGSGPTLCPAQILVALGVVTTCLLDSAAAGLEEQLHHQRHLQLSICPVTERTRLPDRATRTRTSPRQKLAAVLARRRVTLAHGRRHLARGGSVAQHFACTNPNWWDRLVLIDTTCRGRGPMKPKCWVERARARAAIWRGRPVVDRRLLKIGFTEMASPVGAPRTHRSALCVRDRFANLRRGCTGAGLRGVLAPADLRPPLPANTKSV